MSSLKWLWGYLKTYKFRFLIGFLSVAVFSALSLSVPYIMGQVVDRVIIGQERDALGVLLGALILITVVRTSMAYGQGMIFETVSQNVIHKIRSDMYSILNKLDFTFFDSTRTGDIMSRMTGDLEAVRHFMSHVSHQIFKCFVLLVLTITMMFTINVQFAAIILALSPVILVVGWIFANQVRPRFSDIRKQFSKLNTTVQENVSGNRVVKAFAKEEYEIEKFDRENEGYKEKMLAASRVWEKYLPVLELICNSMSFVVLLAGGWMVIQKSLTYGELVTFNSLVWRVTNPMRMLGWLINDSQRFVASAEKIIDVMKTEPAIKNDGVKLDQFEMKGKIEFHDVWFKYDKEPVLEDINFVIQPGQRVAFIGATGSGKSTIMNLICRFYDVDEGRILIDRVNVKNIDLKTLRSNISIAMQDVFLFTDTIEGNIAYGVPNASVKAVKDVAKMVSAHDFIEEFVEGYDTIVGERGVGLSGGQKQRIALARTLLKNPTVLILDDTTSSLDMETEHKIQNALEKFNKKRTTLIIAHRISSVKDADQIFVMEKGRIVESGTHEELLRQKGIYYDVYLNQMGDFDHEVIDNKQKVVG